ncbi:hypothetical protein Ddye_015097 [Dipteronia dyeriana]|uniref:Transmembrane protein n=1 Tax=Dipteronia dyeriana TaxID=168575 RepID=A0AAD9U4W2_9ROSI|nr:hypothetical protein Ddye_015097 [Dipteronia dyeriana]
MEEKKIEAKEREFGDESIYTVLFTAGTALLMACLKRLIMMFFIEQWRLWVFLLLNVVLLAIFFTSMPSSKTTTTTTTSTQNQESEEKINISKKPQCGCGPESEEVDDHVNVEKSEKKLEGKRREENDHQKQSMKQSIEDGVNENEADGDDGEEETSRLSKEELNERVEAFIATFRKHLVSDAIRGRSDQHCFNKKKRDNFSSQGDNGS